MVNGSMSHSVKCTYTYALQAYQEGTFRIGSASINIKGKINSKGIGIASLSAKDLLAMPIDVPSIEEQHEISSILDELFINEQQAKETAERVIDQIDSMKKSILARAFRGELGTNDPNDESAVELLKRVL